MGDRVLVGCTTSDNLDFEGGDDDRLPSTCMRSSRSRSLVAFGDEADVGESVAIGGSMGAEELLWLDKPVPIGRG